jgi:glucose-1-phosphate thymidylyltransferase
MKKMIGVIPAAGIASRLRPSRYPKELLPVSYMLDENSGVAIPIPVISLSLAALKAAEVSNCVVVISDRKPDLFAYLGDGSEFGVNIAFVQQVIPNGLLAAVHSAYAWCHESYSCLVLPDTIVHPENALHSVTHLVMEEELDLVLGVFPTSMPEQLGPVRVGCDAEILEVQDKPSITDLKNTWALAAWSPRFWKLLHEVAGSCGDTQPPLGAVFDLAAKNGLRCKAVRFDGGSFIDIGTTAGLARIKDLDSDLFSVRVMVSSNSPYLQSPVTRR